MHVIECSSYQIDLAPSLDPSVGILINLSEDHLDRHGTMQNYAAVKERLVSGVPEGGSAIVGVDDEWCEKIAARLAQAGKRVVQISVRRKLTHGLYVGLQVADPGFLNLQLRTDPWHTLLLINSASSPVRA